MALGSSGGQTGARLGSVWSSECGTRLKNQMNSSLNGSQLGAQTVSDANAMSVTAVVSRLSPTVSSLTQLPSLVILFRPLHRFMNRRTTETIGTQPAVDSNAFHSLIHPSIAF